MLWIELSLDTTNEAVDWVCTLLAKAIAADDMHISEYDDRQADTAWTFTIQIYLPQDERTHQRVSAIASILEPLHRTGLTTELQSLVINQPPKRSPNSLIRRIGDRFVVLSPESDYQVNNPQEIVLRLQTSLAFGIGWHPATVLSLRLLERHVKPTLHTLDLGSGSGILSVAMAKLGATVMAIDNDPMAVAATQDAVQRNHVSTQVTVMCGSLGSASQLGHWMGGDSLEPVPAIAATESFDLIVANIFARVHISLADEFYQALRTTAKHSGVLITAGYTSDRDEDIILAMSEAGLSVCDRLQVDEWSAIAFCKSKPKDRWRREAPPPIFGFYILSKTYIAIYFEKDQSHIKKVGGYMVYTPLIVFTLVVMLFLGTAFTLSYFWWADRYKTPEVIAAEVMQFSEQFTNAFSVFAVGMLAFGLILISINFSVK